VRNGWIGFDPSSTATPKRRLRFARFVAASALLRLTRPANAMVAGAGALVGAALVSPTLALGRWALLGALASIAFAAAGNVRNDITDVEVDRLAHPERPLVKGTVSARAARFLAIILYIVALESAALVSLPALLLVVLALPLMELYERGLKREGLPGNVTIGALTAAPFLMGALAAARDAADATWSTLWPAEVARPVLVAVALLAALATVGREILKDIEDREGDARAGARRTLPMRIGTLGAAVVAAGFLVAAVLLSPLPWRLETVLAWPYLPGVAVADACFLAAAATGARRPGMAQRLAKLGMIAALAALLVGRVGRGAS